MPVRTDESLRNWFERLQGLCEDLFPENDDRVVLALKNDFAPLRSSLPRTPAPDTPAPYFRLALDA